MTFGFYVEPTLLDILHDNVFTIVIAIRQLIGLAALYQWQYIAYLTSIAITYYFCKVF